MWELRSLIILTLQKKCWMGSVFPSGFPWTIDLNLVVDEEGVLSFVKELASKYNTCYKPKELKTSYGSTVTISNGPLWMENQQIPRKWHRF